MRKAAPVVRERVVDAAQATADAAAPATRAALRRVRSLAQAAAKKRRSRSERPAAADDFGYESDPDR